MSAHPEPDRGAIAFAERLMSGFDSSRKHAQLMQVATDGETFGHHSRFGDMALAYAIRKIEGQGLARITNYAEYLALHPPTHEVTIRENTSWSCAHGVERSTPAGVKGSVEVEPILSRQSANEQQSSEHE